MIKTIQNAQRLYRLKLDQPLPNYKRTIFYDILNSKAKITGIYGSRGVGKTTLLLQILKELEFKQKEKLYVSCDHPMFQTISLFDFVDEFAKYGGEVIVIDEIHKIRDFQTQIKLIYDFLSIKLFFSGSSAVEITNADFSRRYSMYHLPILSLREFLELSLQIKLPAFSLKDILQNHEEITHNIINKLPNKKILKYYREFLDIGVYPFYFEDKSRYVQKVYENINTILYTDLVSINVEFSKIEALKKLIITICISNPLEITIEKLAKTVGISKPTLYKYINILSRAELMHHIVYEAKRYKNLRKPDKLYLNNTNMFNSLCLNPNIGTIRETFFVSMLYKKHLINYIDKGDFIVDEKYTFEIGGKNKSFNQIKDLPNSFIVADDIEVGFGNKIPLWLFGFLY